MKLIEYKNTAEMMQKVAETVAANLELALAKGSSASLAVPGGSTPGPMFDHLSQADLNWPAITVMLSDERWVPSDSARSNAALLGDRLFVNNAADAHFVPFYQSDSDVIEGAKSVSDIVERSLPLDVAVLGMGADMHTASLFPGAPELPAAQAIDADAVMPMSPGGDLEPRVTLSARVLEAADHIHVLIVGPEKRDALEQAQREGADTAPIAQFLPHATVHWCP